MDYKKEILQRIDALSGARAPYEIFADWVEATALALANTSQWIRNAIWQEREQRYLDIMGRYKPEGRQWITEMTGLLTMALEDKMEDVLGALYMQGGLGNKHTGQFFTPYHLSQLAARLTVDPSTLKDGEVITLNEPTCGGGGMIIAAAEILRDAGINYQRRLRVIAQDLDYKAVYMCYTQLSLLGIRATVAQGDTLARPYIVDKIDPRHVYYTPAEMGLLV